MFRHKPSVTERIAHMGSELADGGADSAKRVLKRGPGKLDSYAAGALVVGMGNWLSMSLFNFDAVKAVAGSKGVPGRAAYGALGAAALYATLRGGRRATR